MLLLIIKLQVSIDFQSADCLTLFLQGMSLRLEVLPEDQPSLHFSVAGGLHSRCGCTPVNQTYLSPICASYALKRTVPWRSVRNSWEFFLDDHLDSFEDPDFAFKLSQELITILDLGGFKLTNWIRTVTKVNNELNPSENAPQQGSKNVITCADKSSHLLGLKWDHIEDTFVVNRAVNRDIENSITQRTVFSFLSSVFDPIGLAAPLR